MISADPGQPFFAAGGVSRGPSPRSKLPSAGDSRRSVAATMPLMLPDMTFPGISGKETTDIPADKLQRGLAPHISTDCTTADAC